MSKYNGFKNWPEHDAAIEGNAIRQRLLATLRRLDLGECGIEEELWEAFAMLDAACSKIPPKKP